MIGVDEVGRGCWAGPLLVVAARQTGELPSGLKDSKLLAKAQRAAIYELLSTKCEFGEGWVSAAEIDRLGLAKALRLGVARSLERLQAQINEEIIMDGAVNYCSKKYENARCLVDGDNLLPIISAASIYAKVTRDKFMAELAKKHPRYGFESHVGYGTKAHRLALKTHGALKYIHRYSYSPIKRLARSEERP